MRFALLTWSCCCFDWKTSRKFLPWLLEASTLKLELNRIERKSYKLTSCIIVHRQLLRKVAAGLNVSHDFPHILLVTPIKFVYCATAVHSHWQPLLPSHEGRRSSSADSAFPPAPPLPGPLVLATLPHTFFISKVYVLKTRTFSFSAYYFLSVLLLFLYGTLVHYHMIWNLAETW